jgi:hypothetical protein
MEHKRRRVFLSYAQTDERYVRALINELPDVDVSGPAGPLATASSDYIKRVIRSDIEGAGVTVVFLSDRALRSPWVQWEVGASQALGKPVIPILVEGEATALPEWLTGIVFIDARGQPLGEVAKKLTEALSSAGH